MPWFLRLLTGLPNLITQGFAYLNKKEDVGLEKYKVDGQVDQSLIAADVSRMQAIAALNTASLQFAGDRWMRYLFAYPLGAWWILLMFDSTLGKTLHFPTTAFKLPAPADEWAGWIIAYLFIHTTITQVMKR